MTWAFTIRALFTCTTRNKSTIHSSQRVGLVEHLLQTMRPITFIIDALTPEWSTWDSRNLKPQGTETGQSPADKQVTRGEPPPAPSSSTTKANHTYSKPAVATGFGQPEHASASLLGRTRLHWEARTEYPAKPLRPS